MVGASSPGYVLEISTDALLKTKGKLLVTGWNQYYDTHQRKYADTRIAKKRVETPSKPVKPRQNDLRKIYASECEMQELREKYQ